MDKSVNKGYSICLDSGAWSAYTQKKEIDLDAYMQYISDYKHLLDYYVNLDVIGVDTGQKSYDNYMRMVKEGFNPIPVFHIGSEPKYLHRYLAVTDYVALGAIAKTENKSRMWSLDQVWNELLTDENGAPLARIHGFGITSFRVLRYYPWYSVDSSSWVQYGRYGVVLIPKWRQGNWTYEADPIKIVVSSRKVKENRQQYLKLPQPQRKMVRRYLYSVGFTYDDVSTNCIARDTVNLAYLMGLQDLYFGKEKKLYKPINAPFLGKKALLYRHEVDPTGGKIYTAGNFPVMKDIEKERAVKDKFEPNFHRLVSYFFRKELDAVFQLKREEINNGRDGEREVGEDSVGTQTGDRL